MVASTVPPEPDLGENRPYRQPSPNGDELSPTKGADLSSKAPVESPDRKRENSPYFVKFD